MKTPIVFLVFNRPEHTARVFAAIRESRPEKLLIIADGPRRDRPDDQENCVRVREIVRQVDWECDVHEHFSDLNRGCAENVAGGITWAFEQVETAIILEDDCLPGPDFFRFCDEVIPRYLRSRRQSFSKPNDYIFPTLAKQRVGGKTGLSQQFMNLIKTAGIPNEPIRVTVTGKGRKFYPLGFHSFRHTTVSNLENMGVPKEIRMLHVGHSSNAHERYSHREVESIRVALKDYPTIHPKPLE